VNEGGGGTSRDGKPYLHGVQVGEKMYLSFDLEATHAGGHSSVPTRENAIYDLAAALDGVSRLELPARVGYVTRSSFARLANIESGALAEAIAAIAAAARERARCASLPPCPLQRAASHHLRGHEDRGGHAEMRFPSGRRRS